MKETFVFYKSWSEALQGVPDDVRLEVYDSIIEYAFSGKVPSLKPMALMAFTFIKNDIDRASENYQKIVARNRENGKNGGRPKNQTVAETQHNPNNPNNPVGFLETQQNPNEYDNEYDYGNDVLLEKEPKEKNIIKKVQAENFHEINSEPEEKEKSSAKKEKPNPPDLEAFESYAMEIYQNELKTDFPPFQFAVRSKYESWHNAGWKDGHGKEIKNWKSKLKNTIPHLKPIYQNGFTNHRNNAGKISGRSNLTTDKIRPEFT